MSTDKITVTISPDKEFCCEVWPLISGYFGWMAYEHSPSILTMPHIQLDTAKMRVNFCPSCGKEIRSINMAREDIQ